MPKKILVINDDAQVRELIQTYLELKDYDISMASSGKEGIEKAKTIIPDLILLDVMMPEMNGYETCKLLKSQTITKEIPVIFVSSLLDSKDKTKGLESGAVDFINNTSDYAEILARIDIHLKIKDLNQQLVARNQELMQKQKILNEDLNAAAVIQQSLLPINFPAIPNVKMSWFCSPCAFVGGDICSALQMDHDSTAFYILDVSGHGVPSAMVTVSITQYLQQKLLSSLNSPKQVLTGLNKDYPFEKFNMFSTIFYMILNSKNGKLRYSSAGHPPAIYLSKDKPLTLLDDANGAVIGLTTDSTYDEKEISLQNGDKFILYTDGVVEFCNLHGKRYGDERLFSLLEQVKTHSLEDIIQHIRNSIKEFGETKAAQDDISVLGIEFNKNN